MFNWVRSLLFPLIFAAVFIIWRKYPSRLAYFILTGTLLVALPACMTAIQHLGVGTSIYWDHNALYKIVHFQNWDFRIFMYQTRIGLILEIACFLLGLLYRNSLFKVDSPIVQKSLRSTGDPLLDRIDAFVNNNMREGRIIMDELAKAMGVSRSQIHNKVKSETGLSTSSYITSLRLNHSLDLLHQTKLTISEIAYQVGFSDPNYFTRVFTRKYGISPKRMRQGEVASPSTI